MPKLFKTSINLNKNELQNATIQNLSVDPSTPAKGQVFYDTDDNRIKVNIGTPGSPNFLKLLIEGEGTSSIQGASDVTITGLATGNILVWDGVDSFDNKSLTGDVTMAETGVTTISANAVTYPKMQDTAQSGVVLGRVTAGAGVVEEVVIDTDLSTVSASHDTVASALAIKTYVDALLGANDAMLYKGVIDCSTNPNYPAGDAGHTYKVSVAGKIGGASGVNVEVGDMVICTVDGSLTGDQATVGANWNVIQVNIDGAVTSSSVTSTDNNIATYDGTSGKIIQDSGIAISSLAQKYTADFVVGDWAGAGPYTLTITSATHLLGAEKSLVVKVYEDGTPNSEVETDLTVSDTGEVVITSNSTFAGHYVIIG